MWLRDPASGAALQFPVNPPRIQVKGEADIETVTIARLGEVDWHAGNKRAVLTWESFLPRLYDPSYCRYQQVPDPVDARDRLTAWRVAGTVLRLIVTQEDVSGRRRDILNAPVRIASFNPEHRGGEPGDIYFDITLRQYREVKIRTTAEAGTAPARLDLKPVPGRYTVQTGDTLWLIAKQQLGSGERWREIYALNTDLIGPDPGVITVGMTLAMPGAGAPATGPAPEPPPSEELPRYILDSDGVPIYNPEWP